ncbi:MAG: tetratricopeptide repeat protein [Bryobacteraceae bacterium]|nr:tetratricopeptide repeat protein [Bryobacteraceae bacterium]
MRHGCLILLRYRMILHGLFLAGSFAIGGVCVRAQQAAPPELQSHLDRAQVFLDQQKYSDLVRELRAAIAIWPQTRGAYYQLGFGLFQLGRTAEAGVAFAKELEFSPPDPYSLYYLGRLRVNAGQRRKALEFFERSLASGEVLDVRQRVGSLYLALGLYNDAVPFLESSVRARPEDGGLHYLLARAYKEKGRLKDAEAEFNATARWKSKTATDLQLLMKLRQSLTAQTGSATSALAAELAGSSDTDLLIAAATTLGQAERHQDTIPLLTKAIALQPKLAEAHYNLARAYLALGHDDKVEAELRTAVEVNPEVYEAQVLLGTLLAQSGDSERSIPHLRKAVSLRSPTARLLMMLGLQYYKERYYSEAVKSLTEATQLDPNNADPRFLLIQALYKNLDYERALAFAEETLNRFPDKPLAHFHVGAQLNNFGRLQEAASQLELALKKDPTLLEARAMFGDVLFKMGKAQECLGEFRRVLAGNPKWMDAHAGIGKALIQLKRYPEAATAMEEAVRIDPDMPSLHLYLSQSYRGLGRLDDARREAQIFAKLNEDRARARDSDVERTYPQPPGL